MPLRFAERLKRQLKKLKGPPEPWTGEVLNLHGQGYRASEIAKRLNKPYSKVCRVISGQMEAFDVLAGFNKEFRKQRKRELVKQYRSYPNASRQGKK